MYLCRGDLLAGDSPGVSGGFFVDPIGESSRPEFRLGDGVIMFTSTKFSSPPKFEPSDRRAPSSVFGFVRVGVVAFVVVPPESVRAYVPFAGEARTSVNRFRDLGVPPAVGDFFADAAAAAAARPSAAGVHGNTLTTLSSFLLSAPPGLKKGTGPESHDPSGVAPSASKFGVIMPCGHSDFAAHVNGVAMPSWLPLLVTTNAGVAAKCGVRVGGNWRSPSTPPFTGVPKPSSSACLGGGGENERGERGKISEPKAKAISCDYFYFLGDVPVDSGKAYRPRPARTCRAT